MQYRDEHGGSAVSECMYCWSPQYIYVYILVKIYFFYLLIFLTCVFLLEKKQCCPYLLNIVDFLDNCSPKQDSWFFIEGFSYQVAQIRNMKT